MDTGHEFQQKRGNKQDALDVIWMYFVGAMFLICTIPLAGYWT